MQTTYLDPNEVPTQLRGAYTGKQFRAVVTDSVTIPSYAGLWDGGSRDTYRVVRMADGAELPASDNMSAPWDNSRRDRKVDLCRGICVIKHTIFSGKDMGLTIYATSHDVAPMLPAPVELTDNERIVLIATRSYKSSYNGRDRYDMARDDVCGFNRDAEFMSRATWDETKQALIDRGYLNKRGAITTSGRNAVGNDRL